LLQGISSVLGRAPAAPRRDQSAKCLRKSNSDSVLSHCRPFCALLEIANPGTGAAIGIRRPGLTILRDHHAATTALRPAMRHPAQARAPQPAPRAANWPRQAQIAPRSANQPEPASGSQTRRIRRAAPPPSAGRRMNPSEHHCDVTANERCGFRKPLSF